MSPVQQSAPSWVLKNFLVQTSGGPKAVHGARQKRPVTKSFPPRIHSHPYAGGRRRGPQTHIAWSLQTQLGLREVRRMILNRRLIETPFMLRKGVDTSTDPEGRIATGFIITIPVDASTDEEFSYQHAYAVTAMHCAYSHSSGNRKLVAESPWMEGQPIVPGTLPEFNWRYLRADELLTSEDDKRNLPDEDWVDLAVQASNLPNYSGIVIGKSLRAVPVESLLVRQKEYPNELLGAETTTVGLFHYYRGTDDVIEPIVRFGRIVMEPVSTVRGALGKMQVILIESLAAEGMSGSPVFVNADERNPLLLGVHVGHAPVFAPKGGASKQVGSGHSGVSLVAPADKLLQLLEVEDLRAERARISDLVDSSPWRFRDRRHRERAHLTLTEESFLDEDDYREEHPDTFRFLLLRLRDTARPQVHDFWNAADVAALGNTISIRALVEKFFSTIKWRDGYYRSIG